MTVQYVGDIILFEKVDKLKRYLQQQAGGMYKLYYKIQNSIFNNNY